MVKCLLCGSDLTEKIYSEQGYDQKPYNIFRCKECDLGFVFPRPQQEYLNSLYSCYYGADSKEGASDHLTFRKPVFTKISQLMKPTYKSGARHLDVGCGNGDFIQETQKQGWKSSGVEVSDTAVNVAVQSRQLDVIQSDLKTLPFLDQSFDVVTVLDVLEHLLDPHLTLNSIYRSLKPGGTLIVQVPNTPFQLAKASLKSSGTRMATPLHVNHFSEKSLRKLAEMSNFKDIKIRPGFADGAGIKLKLKALYSRAAYGLNACTGIQFGHNLLMSCRKV